MLGVQMHELAMVCKHAYAMAIVLGGLVGTHPSPAPMDEMELIRHIQTLRV